MQLIIFAGAFPVAEEKELVGYLSYYHKFIRDKELRDLLIYQPPADKDRRAYLKRLYLT